jgi:tol-pal system protein YbgF
MSRNVLRLSAMVGLVPVLVMLVALTVAGCGSSEESMDEWTQEPAATPTSMLEYRIDSLTQDNARMRDQLESVSTENRKLVARNAELETKINELSTAQPAVTTPAVSSVDASSGYEGALAKYKAHDFEGAINSFQALIDGNIEPRLVDNCHYWIGESYYGLRQYKNALKEFKTVIGLPRSEKKADATLMSGNCSAVLGDAAAAREAYEKVVADFPTSPLVDKAKDKLAKMK